MQSAHSTMNGSSPRDPINGIGQSLEKTIGQSQTLFSELADFTNRESMQFVQRQFQNATLAFAALDYQRNLDGLIGAQQAWLEVMRAYSDQGERYGEMFRSLVQHAHGPRHHSVTPHKAPSRKAGRRKKATVKGHARSTT